MLSLVKVLAELDTARFEEIIDASPRKIRKELARRVGAKKKSSSSALSSAKRRGDESKAIQEALRAKPVEDESLQDLVRNYFFRRRALLADALDFLEIPHKEGLTDEDLDDLQTLESTRAEALRGRLVEKHPPHDVDLYFALMGIPS
jgi:hypothetical protein